MQRQNTSQSGFATMDLMLALLVSSLIALLAFFQSQRATDVSNAQLQADAMLAIRGAAHKLVMQNYAAYQNGLPVTANSVTLAHGTSSGQSLRPTVANLRSMDLGANAALDNGLYKNLNTATYDIQISKSPAGCTAASATCNVSGLVCLNQPMRSRESAVGEVDGIGLGAYLNKMGGIGGSSMVGAPGTILGSDGTWSATNPIAGTPAGIICARFGFGSTEGDYLSKGDPRDPDFKGGVTISGTIPGSPYSLIVNGDANITGSLTIGGGGVVGAACSPNLSMVWGDIAGVPTLMKCVGGVLTPADLAYSSANTACTPEGRIAQSSTGSFLICRDGRYRPMADMVGRVGFYDVQLYGQGQVVTTPVCDASTQPRIIAMGVVSACSVGGGSACSNSTGAFQGNILAGNVVSIVGSDGVTPAGTDAKLTVASLCTAS
jgi:hypothetical protein